MITVNSELNAQEDLIYPLDQGQWDDLDLTWEEVTSWYFDSPVTANWLSERIELGAANDFNLILETQANGSVEYEVYTSNTGAFNGEETTVLINQGDQNIPGFNGKFLTVGVKVTKTNSQLNTISSVQITINKQKQTDTIVNVDTSSLSGSITARQINLTRKYSKISNIIVSPREVTAYALDLYVSNYATSTTLIPRVISKSSTSPTIALLGIDGSSKDGVIDLEIIGLPEQYMQGNNLYNR